MWLIQLIKRSGWSPKSRLSTGQRVVSVRPYSRRPAKLLRNELNAIADAQNWNSELIERGVDPGSVLDVDAVRPAGKDDADRVLLLDFLDGNGIGLDLAVNAALAHPTCDEMVILSAKVDDQYQLMVLHKLLPYQTNPVITLFCHQFRQKATT